MLVEVREYQCLPGMRDTWVAFMRTTVLPFQERHGMVVLAQFAATDDEDRYVWIRLFRDAEHRAQLTGQVYGDPEWTDVIAPQVGCYLVRGGARITLLNPLEEAGGPWADALGAALAPGTA